MNVSVSMKCSVHEKNKKMYSVVLTLNNKLDQSPRYALEIGLVNEHVGEKINVPHG